MDRFTEVSPRYTVSAWEMYRHKIGRLRVEDGVHYSGSFLILKFFGRHSDAVTDYYSEE